jgi:threonine dehydrogenase-like Zn-dependent dehydrogenase
MLSYGTVECSVPPHVWGGFSELLPLHPNTVLHRLVPDLTAEAAVLFNPLGAGVEWAVSGAGTRLGDTAVVLGSGQRGLACVVALRAAGAGPVVVTGLASDRHKLELALELGADAAVDVTTHDLGEVVADLTDGRGADVVIDTTPKATEAFLQALEVVRRGGTICCAGIKGGRYVEGFDLDQLIAKAVTVRGMFATNSASFGQALQILATRDLPLERLQTHSFPLDQAPDALETLGGDRPGERAIYVAVHPQE